MPTSAFPSNATLYVSDLDGTLLQGDATLSPFARDSLNALLDAGLAFTVATARSVTSVRAVLEGLRLRLPIVATNGAYLSDFATGRHFRVNTIDPALLDDVLRICLDAGVVPLVGTSENETDQIYYSDVRSPGLDEYVRNRSLVGDPRLCRTGDLRSAFGTPVVSFIMLEPRERLEPVVAALAARHGERLSWYCMEELYMQGGYWLTIHDRRATKDRGIADLREIRELGGARLVVFGDSENDLPMFATADHAVAMANAPGHVRTRAHAVIGTNADDSVVRYLLERHLPAPSR